MFSTALGAGVGFSPGTKPEDSGVVFLKHVGGINPQPRIVYSRLRVRITTGNS